MKKLTIFSLIFALIASPVSANVTITQLPAGSAAASGSTDVFPFVNISTNTTEKMELSDLINLPSMVATYAPLLSPVFQTSMQLGSATTANPFFTILSSSATNTGGFIQFTKNGQSSSYFGFNSGINTGGSTDLDMLLQTPGQILLSPGGTTIRFLMSGAGLLTMSAYGTGILHSGSAGAITSSLVALGTDVSGTLQAAQFPALTGDVTTTAGSLATAIAATTNSTLATLSGVTSLGPSGTTANFFMASPNGSTGAGSFRAIVAADIPTLNQNTTGTASNITATSNATLTTLSALTTASSLATVGTIGSGTWHGTAVGAQYGGTGIDSHSSTGIAQVSSGTWSIAASIPMQSSASITPGTGISSSTSPQVATSYLAPDSVVHLAGQLKSSSGTVTAGSVIGTLAASYRPNRTVTFSVFMVGLGEDGGSYVQISSNGNIICGDNITTTVYPDLNSISFTASN